MRCLALCRRFTSCTRCQTRWRLQGTRLTRCHTRTLHSTVASYSGSAWRKPARAGICGVAGLFLAYAWFAPDKHKSSLRHRILQCCHSRWFSKHSSLLPSVSAESAVHTSESLSSEESRSAVTHDEKGNRYEDLYESRKRLIASIPTAERSRFVWFLKYMHRLGFLLLNFAPLVISWAPLYYFEWFGQSGRQYWTDLLLRCFANGGSAFIKLGQWMSMRADVFPLDICESLATLRVSAPTHSFADTCRLIEESFGRSVDEVFDRFWVDPVASGSIAQVYRAQLRVGSPLQPLEVTKDREGEAMLAGVTAEQTIGEVTPPDELAEKIERSVASLMKSMQIPSEDEYQTRDSLWQRVMKAWKYRKHKSVNQTVYNPSHLDVAVKVRHTAILELLAIDIDLLYKVSNAINLIPLVGKYLKVPFHQTEFSEYLLTQIDLSFEGKALQRFNSMFRDEKYLVRFPQPVPGLVTSDVLVETWETGIPLSHLDMNMLESDERTALSKQCYDIFMKMMLRNNFIHGDCHSGNILVRIGCDPNGSSNSRSSKAKDDGSSGRLYSVEPRPKSFWDMVQQMWKRRSWKSIGSGSNKSGGMSLPFGPIIFLDAGLTAALTDRGMERFGVLMGHIARGQSFEAAEIFAEWTITGDDSKRERFVNQLAQNIEDSFIWRNPTKPRFGVPKMDVGNLVRDVLLLTQSEQITLDSNFSTVIASLGIIEGLITHLDEEADFLLWGVPYLMRFRGLKYLEYLVFGDKTD